MASSDRKRILIIGMSGLVGGLVGRKLVQRHDVVALNRGPVEGVETFRGDIADIDTVRAAFEGVDTVINMATYQSSGDDSPSGAATDFAGYVLTNIEGVYNVYEAASKAAVGRVIFASAGAAVFNYVNDEPYKSLAEARWDDVPPGVARLTHLAPYRPNGVYGATKAWGEALGRAYADGHGMSVICVRVGHVPRPPQTEKDLSSYQASIYCSHRDIAQMFERCVDAPRQVGFDVFFACSRNRGLFRDIDHARQVIGYEPQDGIG